MSWMAWTVPTAAFFGAIALMIVTMTVWEALSPSPTRRGLLPIYTTRGDRLFIGLLCGAFINLGWIAFTTYDQWWALGITAVVMLLLGRFG